MLTYKLTPPGEGSGDSGNTGDSGNDGAEEDSNKYHIYLTDSTKTNGCVENGYYIINNRNFVLSEESYGGWSIATDLNITDAKASPDGAEYRFKSFNTIIYSNNKTIAFLSHLIYTMNI